MDKSIFFHKNSALTKIRKIYTFLFQSLVLLKQKLVGLVMVALHYKKIIFLLIIYKHHLLTF